MEGNNRVGQVPPHIWAHFRKDRDGSGEFRDVSGAYLPNGWDIIEVPYMIINSPPMGELEKS